MLGDWEVKINGLCPPSNPSLAFVFLSVPVPCHCAHIFSPFWILDHSLFCFLFYFLFFWCKRTEEPCYCYTLGCSYECWVEKTQWIAPATLPWSICSAKTLIQYKQKHIPWLKSLWHISDIIKANTGKLPQSSRSARPSLSRRRLSMRICQKRDRNV